VTRFWLTPSSTPPRAAIGADRNPPMTAAAMATIIALV
jgi:hypothetical protein